jgi:hypothetical protein
MRNDRQDRRGVSVDGSPRAPAARQADAEAQSTTDHAIDAQLELETKAFDAAGLVTLNGIGGEWHAPTRYWEQPVILLNTRAHPAALLSVALSRAERVQAFARTLKLSPELDADAADAVSALTRMIEEVVSVLEVAVEHDGVLGAPTSTTEGA